MRDWKAAMKRRVKVLGGGGLAVTLLVLTLGANPTVAFAQQRSAAASKGSVNLFYAGSLVGVMTKELGPAFQRATGYTINGLPGGSDGLANEIKSGTQKPDVFLSASPKADLALEGKANGAWVRWYLPLGTTPLVIGYSSSSSFAHALRTEPWWKVMERKGFRLGRTDPAIDPKGALTVALVQKQARKSHLPKLVSSVLGSPENASQIFPEETLVARLQSGQLDAGFFFAVEAKAAKIPTIKTGVNLNGSYTVTEVRGAKDVAASNALIKFLYSKTARRILSSNGVNIDHPKLVGPQAALPKALGALVKR